MGQPSWLHNHNCMSLILGINSAYHESSAALFKDQELLAFCEEERLSRIKHAKPALVCNSGELPLLSLEYCLQTAKVRWDEVEHVAYSFLPAERYEQNLKHKHPVAPPRGEFGDPEGEQAFLEGLESVPGQLQSLGFKGKLHWVGHHLSHAASAYYASTFSEAAVLVVDGIGEWATTSIWSGKGTKLTKEWELCYPHSLGFLWEKICEFVGFTIYDAGKVMGLAAFGDPKRLREQFSKLCAANSDGGFTIDESLLLPRSPDLSPLENLFGLPHRAARIQKFDASTDQAYADIVAVLQEVTEQIMLGLVAKSIALTGSRRVCMAGGVLLNCVANSKILESNLIEDIYIQPAAHDAGTSLGAAQHIWHQNQRGRKRWHMKSPFLGPSFSDDEIKAILESKGIVFTEEPDIEFAVAELLAANKVVAWFQRSLEVGPRALGHRSILADPRGDDVTELLNARIKFREHFRPFCPSVLEEHLEEWFHMPKVVGNTATHMLAAFKVKSARKKSIPAVIHEDGTCRLQALTLKETPHFHRLVSKFYELTGIPMVLNTSFNKQEPIVCTPAEAIDTFMNTETDYLAVGSFLVERTPNLVCPTIPNIRMASYFESLR
jgi:carbamoyltransferase